CILSGNSADLGGGIFNGGTMTVSGCTLSGNSGFGGGIWNQRTLEVSGCTLSGNSGPDGGGIYNDNGVVSIRDSLLTSNSAAVGSGGGIFSFASDGFAATVTVTDSTLSGNTAARIGGGILNGGSGTLAVTGTTLSGNSASQGGAIYNDLGATLN